MLICEPGYMRDASKRTLDAVDVRDFASHGPLDAAGGPPSPRLRRDRRRTVRAHAATRRRQISAGVDEIAHDHERAPGPRSTRRHPKRLAVRSRPALRGLDRAAFFRRPIGPARAVSSLPASSDRAAAEDEVGPPADVVRELDLRGEHVDRRGVVRRQLRAARVVDRQLASVERQRDAGRDAGPSGSPTSAGRQPPSRTCPSR